MCQLRVKERIFYNIYRKFGGENLGKGAPPSGEGRPNSQTNGFRKLVQKMKGASAKDERRQKIVHFLQQVLRRSNYRFKMLSRHPRRPTSTTDDPIGLRVPLLPLPWIRNCPRQSKPFRGFCNKLGHPTALQLNEGEDPCDAAAFRRAYTHPTSLQTE